MNTNAWITVERDRAITWRDWCRWWLGGSEGPEPPLTAWEKKAVCRLADMEFIFRGFLRPVILTKTWIMLSVYDVTPAEIQSGYTQLGDAEAGGDFGCAGYWLWHPGQAVAAYVDLYPWRPTQVLQFMPPVADESGIPQPATEIRDVNLVLGQPPREFPA